MRETLKEFIRYIRHQAPDLSRVKGRLQELREQSDNMGFPYGGFWEPLFQNIQIFARS